MIGCRRRVRQWLPVTAAYAFTMPVAVEPVLATPARCRSPWTCRWCHRGRCRTRVEGARAAAGRRGRPRCGVEDRLGRRRGERQAAVRDVGVAVLADDERRDTRRRAGWPSTCPAGTGSSRRCCPGSHAPRSRLFGVPSGLRVPVRLGHVMRVGGGHRGSAEVERVVRGVVGVAARCGDVVLLRARSWRSTTSSSTGRARPRDTTPLLSVGTVMQELSTVRGTSRCPPGSPDWSCQVGLPRSVASLPSGGERQRAVARA